MAEEHDRRDTAAQGSRSDELGGGESLEDESDVRLHSELAHEAKRVVTHPVEETHRLSEELAAGETDTTPVIAITALAIWLGALVVVVIALVFVAIYLT
jgi:hypothetical protein